MPFKTEPRSKSEPMRPPTRQLSNDLTSLVDDADQDDEDCYVNPWLLKEGLIGENSTHTNSTASETESSDDFDYRRVRFSATLKQYWIESHKSFTDEERSLCWYSSEEKTKRNNKVEKIVTRLEARKPEKRSSPYRGLECWTDKGALELDKQIFATLSAVMDEQDRQWFNDITDPAQIAAISQIVTAKSAVKALNVAYDDEMAAAAIYGEDNANKCNFADDASSVGSMASFASTTKKPKKVRRSGRRKSRGENTPRRTKKKDSKKKKTDRADPPAKVTKKRVAKKE